MDKKVTPKELVVITNQALLSIQQAASQEKVLQFLRDKQYDCFSVFIWLHTSGFMEAELEACQNQKRFTNSEAAYIIQLSLYIYKKFYEEIVTSKCLKNLKQLQKQQFGKYALKQSREKIQKQKNSQKLEDSQLKKLTLQFLEKKNKKEAYLKSDFNSLCDRVMSFSDFNSVFDEICYNWLRHEIEKQRNDSHNLCCKTIYFKDELLYADESATQQFKKYNWPIANKNMIFHITKTIVGFLNEKGGIMYIGISEDKTKKVTVAGITLSMNELKEVFEFFTSKIVKQIYPKHPQFESKLESCEINERNGKFIINPYISLDYQCVSYLKEIEDKKQKEEQKNKKEDKQKQKQVKLNYINLLEKEKHLYIVKVLVKPGHPKHLYHALTNDQKGLDFFVRKDRNVQKLPFPDAHDKIMKKLANFQKAVDEEEERKKLAPQKFHQDCRFNVETPVNFSEDEDDD